MILIERPLDMGEAQLAKDTEKGVQPSCARIIGIPSEGEKRRIWEEQLTRPRSAGEIRPTCG